MGAGRWGFFCYDESEAIVKQWDTCLLYEYVRTSVSVTGPGHCEALTKPFGNNEYCGIITILSHLGVHVCHSAWVTGNSNVLYIPG